MAVEKDSGGNGSTLASIVSNNPTASLPSPEEAALQDLWLQFFEMTSAAPRTPPTTSSTQTMVRPNPPQAVPYARGPRPQHRPFNNDPPTPASSQVRRKQRPNDHWHLLPSELHQGLYEALGPHGADWWMGYYLRANNMDVDCALDDLLRHIHWRRRIAQVDSELLPWGEAGAWRSLHDPHADPRERRVSEGFLRFPRTKTARILKGRDRQGRMIGYVQVKYNRMGIYPVESYERYIIFHVETANLMMGDSRGDGIMVLDFEDYKIHNMDFRALKTIMKIMRDYYPQRLGDVIIHRVPLLFVGVWYLAKTVIREEYHSRVHFTKDLSELEQYIPFESIPKEAGGGDDTNWHYEPPDLNDPSNGGGGEELQQERAYERALLEEKRSKLVQLFEETTKEWIDASRQGRETRGLQALRVKYQQDLKALFWQLDPYTRSRTIYDKLGWIRAPKSSDTYLPQARVVRQS